MVLNCTQGQKGILALQHSTLLANHAILLSWARHPEQIICPYSPLTFSDGLALQNWHCCLYWGHLWALALGCVPGKNRAFQLHVANVFLPRRSAIRRSVIIWKGDDRCVSLSLLLRTFQWIASLSVFLLKNHASDIPSISLLPYYSKRAPKESYFWFPQKISCAPHGLFPCQGDFHCSG